MSDPFDDDNDSTRGVTLPELIRRAVRAELAEGVRSHIPVRVERYDATKGQVDVLPLIKDFHRDETGALVVAGVPVITNIPVAFFAAGGFAITVKIVAGQTLGRLSFVDRSMDAWLSGDGQVVDPELYVRNSLADAWFEPGLQPFGAPLAYVPTDRLKIGQDDASGGIIEILDDGSIIAHGKGGGTLTLDASGNGSLVAAADKDISVEASGTGAVNLNATAATGKIGLGPVASLQVIVFGALDGLGFPIQQAPAAVSGGGPGLSIVKSG